MNDTTENSKITIDGVEYDMEDLSVEAKNQIGNIMFSDEQILQLKNELAISNTARHGYLIAFKKELSQISGGGNG
jgi:hypothetical protein